jgi:hypothetical protein
MVQPYALVTSMAIPIGEIVPAAGMVIAEDESPTQLVAMS